MTPRAIYGAYVRRGSDGRITRYPDGTFTRSSEGARWNPVSLALNGWAGVDVLRVAPSILTPDGFEYYLLEGARTNAMPDSAAMTEPPKSHLNSPTVTDDDDTAPDGTGMDLITYAAGGVAGQVRQLLDDTLFTDASKSAWSCFLKGDGADQLRLFVRDKALATALDETVTPAAAIERIVRIVDNGSGSSDPLVSLIEVTDAGAFHAWGWQIEPNAHFASSPIRTAGGIATRALDRLFVDSTPFGTDTPFYFYCRPAFSSAEFAATSQWAMMFHFDGNEGVLFRPGGGATRISVSNSVGGIRVERTVTFDAHQELKVTVDPAAGDLTVEGATTGDGTSNVTPWTWGSVANVDIGAQSTIRNFFGLLGEPVAP